MRPSNSLALEQHRQKWFRSASSRTKLIGPERPLGRAHIGRSAEPGIVSFDCGLAAALRTRRCCISASDPRPEPARRAESKDTRPRSAREIELEAIFERAARIPAHDERSDHEIVGYDDIGTVG
jgi:hypothetical protein